MNDFPEDQWVEFPNEELAKIGKTQCVYKPSNYPGPIAIDAYIASPGCQPVIWVDKEQIKKIYGLE